MSKLEIESVQIENGSLVTYKGSHNFSVVVALALIQSSKLLQSEPNFYYFIENFDKLLSKSQKIAEYYNLKKEFKRFQLIRFRIDPQYPQILLKLKSKEIRSISIIFRCIMISFCPKFSEKILAGTVLFPKSFYYSILNCLSSFLGVTINIDQGELEDSENLNESNYIPPDLDLNQSNYSESPLKLFKVSETFKFEAPISLSPIITFKVTQASFIFYLYCESSSLPNLNKVERLKSLFQSLLNLSPGLNNVLRPADPRYENDIILTDRTINRPYLRRLNNRQ